MLSPIQFFRSMSITEGIRNAVYFSIVIFYIRSVFIYLYSLHRGYFLNPSIRVAPVSAQYAAIFLGIAPFLFLLIMYTQAVFINRIGNFFGGAGNFEGAFKVLAYVLFITLFTFIPVLGIIPAIYAGILMIIGIKIVFDIDWISSILTILFSYVFTSFLYLILFGIPAFAAKFLNINI